jgi:hypothetical protein
MLSTITNKKYGLIQVSPTSQELKGYYDMISSGKLYGAVKTGRDGDKKLFVEDCEDDLGFGIYRVFSEKKSCDMYISLVCANMKYDRSNFATWETNQEDLTNTLINLNKETKAHFGSTITATGCVYREGQSFVILDIYWSGNEKNMV